MKEGELWMYVPAHVPRSEEIPSYARLYLVLSICSEFTYLMSLDDGTSDAYRSDIQEELFGYGWQRIRT